MLRRPTLMQVAVLACLAAVAAWAAEVTGKWSGEMNGPNGGITLTANFKQDGVKLTGTLDRPGGEPMQIQEEKSRVTKSCLRWHSTI